MGQVVVALLMDKVSARHVQVGPVLLGLLLFMNTHDESSGMSMSLESGALGALVAKIGMAKTIGLGAALIGAAIMCVFRPPKTRKELFYQGAVALGGSMLFGSFGVALVDSWLHLGSESLIAPVYGLIGALSWGAFGGMAHWRDEKLAKDPLQAVKDVHDIIK